MDVTKIDFVVSDLGAVVVLSGGILQAGGFIDLINDGQPLDNPARCRVDDRKAAVIERGALSEQVSVILLKTFHPLL